MALTDTEIDAKAEDWLNVSAAGPDAKLFRDFARAIEAAASAPILERIAALEAQVEQSEKVAYCHARDAKEPTLKEAQVEQTAQPFADPFTYVIQHLNSNPYALTKDECIEKIKELRALYTSPPKAAPLTETQDVVGYHYSKRTPFGTVVWHVDYAVHPEAIEWFPLVRGTKGITPATVEKGDTP